MASSVKRIYVQGFSEKLHEIFHFIDRLQIHSITCMKRCGDTVADIAIRVRLRDPKNVRPDAFLQQCPNLTRLHFDGWISLPQSWQPKVEPHLLSELTLRFANIDDFDFDPTLFLCALPNLKRLWLDNFNSPTVSSLQYCPELEVLANFRDHDGRVPLPGRKKLLLKDTHAVPEFFGLIQQWSQHLELFYLDISHEETLDQLATFVFPSLTFLYIRLLEDTWGPALRSLFMSSTPNLSALQTDFIDDDALDGLAMAAKSLKRLSLSRPSISSGRLARFLNQVDLHEITLRFDYTPSSDFLDVLEAALHQADNKTASTMTLESYGLKKSNKMEMGLGNAGLN
ncbi:hypothetical protein BJV82DRAFT_581876 [Fennellomyces sp. T-0311]|nr:hypothetical protein BJV82DRAFT_581876 [Fennellomyces sp. T-0311]